MNKNKLFLELYEKTKWIKLECDILHCIDDTLNIVNKKIKKKSNIYLILNYL